MYTVFVSHNASADDMPYVTWFHSTLQSRGIGCYVAEWCREPGKWITDKVKDAINASDIVLVLWTRGGRDSQFVNQEVGYAEDKKPIVPLVEKGVTLEGFLYGRDHIEFDRQNPGDALNAMLSYIYNLKLTKEQQEGMATAALVLLGILFLGAIALSR
jgi:hypothetical protein